MTFVYEQEGGTLLATLPLREKYDLKQTKNTVIQPNILSGASENPASSGGGEHTENFLMKPNWIPFLLH